MTTNYHFLFVIIVLISCTLTAYSSPHTYVNGTKTKKFISKPNFLAKAPIISAPDIPTVATTSNEEQDDEDDDDDVVNMEYYGEWHSANSDSPSQFGYFSQASGFAQFIDNELDDNLNGDSILWLYDGPYKDQKAAEITLSYNYMNDFYIDNATVKRFGASFNVSLYNNNDLGQTKKCRGDFMISLYDTETGLPYQTDYDNDYDNIGAYIKLISHNCELFFESNVSSDDPTVDSQAMFYAILVTVICFTHLYGAMQLVRRISLSEVDGTRYSLITMTIFTSWDIFLCFFHFYGALVADAFFHYFITPAFWYFILASILEARLLGLVWKAKYAQSYSTREDFRRAINFFYVGFYLFITGFVALCCIFLPSTWLFYAASIFFVPQIIHNAIRGQKYQFDQAYVFLLGAMRILLPLYVKGYSNSMFKLTPNSSFVVNYIGIVAFQIFVLYFQSKLGSRFFVPSCFLPVRYNYMTKISLNTSTTENEELDLCSICMDNLANEASNATTGLLNKKPKDYVSVMQTPCKHMFHEPCLKGWMDVKLECPFCRAPLPSVD